MSEGLSSFSFLGYDAAGRKVKGTRSAESADRLGRTLVSEGIQVSSIESASTHRLALPWRASRTMSSQNCALIMRQLATLNESGLPIDECLNLMISQTDKDALKEVLRIWNQKLAEGCSLNKAMRYGPQKMTESVIAAVSVAEETGHLASVLARLADELEEGATARQDLRKGLVYPVVMAVVGVVVVLAMMIWVVPQVTRIFIAQRIELPFLTRAMISASEFLTTYGWLIFIALLLIYSGTQHALRDPAKKLALHQNSLRVPVLGAWLLNADLSDWSRHMGTLLNSGVPIIAAMRIAGASVRNLEIKRTFDQVSEEVKNGQSIHSAMLKHPLIPPLLVHMVGSGEASSQLDMMLLRISNYYSKALKSSTETFLKLLEPALIVLMAGFVMLIVGAVLVPIVRTNHMI